METKYLTRELLKELLDSDSYFYLEGTCPELMKFPRLLEYANNILKNNRQEFSEGDSFILDGDCWDFESANKVIKWFGEEVYQVELPSNSIDFIIEE